MSLEECQRRISQREFRLWQRWLRNEWNVPNRTDHILVKIAMEIRLLRYEHLRRNRTVKFEDFIPKFGAGPSEKINTEQATQAIKSRWFGFVGLKRNDDE